MLKRVLVGVITSPHGLHGEVNVYPTTDELRRFDDLREIILADENDDDDPGRSFKVERVRYHKGRPICKFAGLDTIEEAQKLRTLGIFVDRRDALPLRENEYFIGDLLECTVYLEDGTVYGTLADILKTGANDVYAVLFLLVCVFVRYSPHRGFSHSLLALALEAAVLRLVMKEAVPAFSIAYVSHLLLDILNKRPVRILFPLKKGFRLGWFYVNRRADKTLLFLGAVWLTAISVYCAGAW